MIILKVRNLLKFTKHEIWKIIWIYSEKEKNEEERNTQASGMEMKKMFGIKHVFKGYFFDISNTNPILNIN